MFVLMNLVANVGPEFLGHIAGGIQHCVRAPDADGIAQRALAFGMVGIRDAGGDGAAHDLGVIELRCATIGARHEDAANGIHDTAPGGAGAELEITRVLMQERWEHRSGHQRADSGVGVERAITLRVTLQSLSIGWIAVPGLSDQGDNSDKRNGNRIGHGFRGEQEFGLGGKRRELVLFFNKGVVCEDEEQAIVLQGNLLRYGSDTWGFGARRRLLLSVNGEREQ